MAIKIGIRINERWLDDEDDQGLRFLKQIGVDRVDIPMSMIAGHREEGIFTREAFEQLTDRIRAVGLEVERVNTDTWQVKRIYLDQEDADRQLDYLQQIAQLLGEAQVPVMGVLPFTSQSVVSRAPGYSRPKGRGGYGHLHFDLSEGSQPVEVEAKPTADEIWERTLRIYRALIPIAEATGMKLAQHGNDPPIADYCGVPQILCRFADFQRLFDEVPSPQNGMTFCVGTRYESGEDVFEGIRRFGGQGKIFHVHFRNVRGPIKRLGGYSEVMLDDGDLNMVQLVRALHDVGYEGAIDFDHVRELSGDTPTGRQYIGFCVGYMRAALQSLG